MENNIEGNELDISDENPDIYTITLNQYQIDKLQQGKRFMAANGFGLFILLRRSKEDEHE